MQINSIIRLNKQKSQKKKVIEWRKLKYIYTVLNYDTSLHYQNSGALIIKL